MNARKLQYTVITYNIFYNNPRRNRYVEIVEKYEWRSDFNKIKCTDLILINYKKYSFNS